MIPSAAMSRPLRQLLCLLLLAATLSCAQADRLPRVLVFGDSNTWGWIPTPQGLPTRRLDDAHRWPGVLASALGGRAQVMVDGLSGRTVDVDYPTPLVGLPGDLFNGRTHLPEALAREAPLDLVVIMLGTNDLRSDLHRSPTAIAQGLAGLVDQVSELGHGVATRYPPPQVLVVVPPPLGDVSATPLRANFTGMAPKSHALTPAVQRALNNRHATLYVAEEATGPLAGVDGIHLTAAQHQRLGQALIPVVTHLIESAPLKDTQP